MGGGGVVEERFCFKERICAFNRRPIFFFFVTAFENTGMTLSIITNKNMELTN